VTADTTADTIGDAYDVVVVGAGVVGAAVARELSAYGLRVALVDAADDVGDGTSKANTAILHTGFDAKPGTLEARLVRRGYELLSAYASEAGIALERTGALLVAWDDVQLAALPGIVDRAAANGYDRARLVGVTELYAREPFLGPGALGGVEVPDEGIVCPWTTPLAFATEAVRAGVSLLLSTRVVSVEPGDEHRGTPHVLATSRGPLRARWVVNAAGLQSDVVDAMFGHHRFTVVPRRGELVVFDKLARRLVRHVLLPVPTSRGKGVLVAPTVFGNVLLGPTAEDLADRTDTGTSVAGLAALRAHGRRILPRLLDEEVTAAYAGLRSATEHDDYVVRLDAAERYVCVGGIRSTGLTASMALAEHVVELLREGGLDLGEPAPRTTPRMPQLGEAEPRPYRRADLVAADPAYGTVVCHCERVTLGEVRDALSSTVPARTVEGVRRRTRATGGRCQGFFCGAHVRALVATR
jgi:glycerol-3-phosphate dehydrogenase